VYRAPALSPAGNPVIFAVNHQHRMVEGSEVEVMPGMDLQPAVNELWRKLDDADPEHSRARKRGAVRTPRSKTA
jgi:hypothetical protein